MSRALLARAIVAGKQQFAASACPAMRSSISGSSSVVAAVARHMQPELGGLLASCQPTNGLIATRQLWSSSPTLMGLQETLQEELNFEEENRRVPEMVKHGPPAPFTLKEAPGDTLLTLSRTHGPEQISISLHVNNQPSADLGGDEDSEAAEEALSTVLFNTQVTKGKQSLVFECETDGTFVAINHVSYEPTEGHDSPSKYTGPVFDELDENLQQEFQDYLEDRGITPALGEYLRHLVHDKEEREYAAWLDNVRKFVS